jgi:hypothetical protein
MHLYLKVHWGQAASMVGSFVTHFSVTETLSGKGFSGLLFWVCRTILELCQLG